MDGWMAKIGNIKPIRLKHRRIRCLSDERGRSVAEDFFQRAKEPQKFTNSSVEIISAKNELRHRIDGTAPPCSC